MPELTLDQNRACQQAVPPIRRRKGPSIQRSVLFREVLDKKVTQWMETRGATRSRIYNAALVAFFDVLTEAERAKAMAINVKLEAELDQ